MMRAWRFSILATLVGISFSPAARTQVPRYQGWVSDYARVLDASSKAHLFALIQELKDKTGAEIAVLTVDTTGGEDIGDYALAVAEEWKPGEKDKDNGVVFVSAVQDRKMYILVGYGLEGILPDGKVGGIEDQYVIPAFKRGDYGGGIRAGVSALAEVIAEDAGVSLNQAPRSPLRPDRGPNLNLGHFLLILIVFLFLGRLLFVPFWGWGRPGRRYFGSSGGFGGFGGGGFGGGGFGGFGGGGFGGGGAGRGW
ncbi:MAG: hypothetical protein A2V67_10280 [Deltaproteobacteria bacterium RBG_13_61_14]|nr:MAG: hypothetical protein A2V67_10280 [Deltaproteobacteria bacterium RBG_13_61_14]